MLIDIILLFLSAGVPYYLFFEKTKLLQKDKIFILSAILLISGMVLSYKIEYTPSTPYIVVALISALFSIYKMNKTNNLYKLTYYVLFFNAPLIIMFQTKESILYASFRDTNRIESNDT